MLWRLSRSMTGLPRSAKRLLTFVVDAGCLSLSLLLALLLRFDSLVLNLQPLLPVMLVTVLASVGAFAIVGVYHSVLRFLSSSVSYALLAGVVLSAMVGALFDGAVSTTPLPLAVFGSYAALGMLAVGGVRILARQFFTAFSGQDAEPLAIYGAGDSGRQISSALMTSPEYRPVAFIDDNIGLQGAVINGLKVYSPSQLPELIRRFPDLGMLLALPSVARRRRQEILHVLAPYGLHVRSLPDMGDILTGTAQAGEIRELDVNDLLGREAVRPNEGLFSACIKRKSVLVTGAGGSIGSELCRQILRSAPARLVIFELSEIALYQIERELRAIVEEDGLAAEVIAILGNAQHRDRMRGVMRAYGIETVYHAAAYKHVPIVEENVVEGMHNNVLSTWVTAESAMEAGVEVFVLVSTDKAVNPTNAMGATKRAAEMVLQGLQQRSSATRFAMVRFGNVLASSGSVVPLFQQQIRGGGPVTVTHPDVIRYFMTIPEAAQLVIQAGAMARGGDVFVLDMGQPVRIVDLARRMINLAGRSVRDAANPAGDIGIKFTGLRPAEKLYEELLIGNNVSGTEHPMIMRAVEHSLPWAQLEPMLRQMLDLSREGDAPAALKVLRQVVREYTPASRVHDLVWNAERNHKAPSPLLDDESSNVAALPVKRVKLVGEGDSL
jgi:FlaA1/EpsC-like NDP-sugar epimerase